MSPARTVSTFALGAALFLAGWWVGRQSREAPPVPTQAAPATPAASQASAPPSRAASAVGPGNYVPPDLASATPAEVQALRQAEAANSAKAAPAATYKGIDGKLHRFDYDDGQARVREARRQERREQLMLELQADPARFAREHALSLKQVQWIVDGDADFPEALLEP